MLIPAAYVLLCVRVCISVCVVQGFEGLKWGEVVDGWEGRKTLGEKSDGETYG